MYAVDASCGHGVELSCIAVWDCGSIDERDGAEARFEMFWDVREGNMAGFDVSGAGVGLDGPVLCGVGVRRGY